jgi:hypothetical protein
MKSKTKKNTNQNKEFTIALIIVLIVVAIVVSTIFLPDLIREWRYRASLVDFVASDTYITDENGNKFYALNRSVEAINTDGVYGLLDGDEYCYIDFMKKEGETPEYIVEYKNKTMGTVLRRDDVGDVTLSVFEPISADICSSTTEYPFDYFIAPDEYLENGGNKRNDEEYMNLIFNSLMNEKEVNAPEKQASALRLKLKSKKYPGLYYTVVFMTDENGISYLYDVGSGKYVLSPDKLTVRLS